MKGSECQFVRYIGNSNTRFIIPVYQRNYDWKEENCRQLYADLVKIAKTGRKSHFFGSIVSANVPDGRYVSFIVIDGQQRLTTVSLILLAMYNLIDKGILTPKDPTLKQCIWEDFLVNKWQPEETRIKLKHVKDDQLAFSKLFSSSDEHIKESNLTLNYNFFYEKLQKQEVTPDELFDAIYKLYIINIQLEADDDPQLIFESLNSTGLDLSEGDKIRNFILMGLPIEQQNEYYEKYWNRIEAYTKLDVSAFVRDYLSVKQQEIPQQKKIYSVFKEYVESRQLSIEEILSDMLDYAKRYAYLLGAKTGTAALDACIYRLNRLETTVTRPFFLEVLRLYNEEKLTISQVTEVFLVAENYLFRRSMCELPTNALNKIFLLLHREIVRYDGTDENYVEKYKYALLSKKEKARCPDNDEFIAAFANRAVYLMNSKNKIYILERLENFGTAEDKDVYRHCDEGTYSIEHIMPQHLTPTWHNELGQDYAQIHDEWLHRIANLTLTAYNSKYRNASFAEKKHMEHGFIDSGIRMNTWIACKDKWTLLELEERSQYLANRALTIWAEPCTSFVPEEKQMDSYDLSDDNELMIGRSIARFAYKSTEQPVTSWVDMYQKVLEMLYAEDSSILTRMANSDGYGLESHLRPTGVGFTKSVEIANGVHVFTGIDTPSKLFVLRKVFQAYEIDFSELVFYLRDENEENRVEAGTRYERRKRYWTYALDFIHEAHGKGSFSNVNPSKQGWISGFIGVQGVSICCVANRDGARVELYIAKNKVEENKRIFDMLYAHMEEIETSLGAPLTWLRGEGIKSSKIEYQLEKVSIENETDWLQMAKFHAEWSKKFYDVLVPYITGQFSNLW